MKRERPSFLPPLLGFLAVFIFFGQAARALELHIPPIVFYNNDELPRPEASLRDELIAAFDERGYGNAFKAMPSANPAGEEGPAFADILAYMQKQNFDFMLYGFVRRAAGYDYAELKIVNKERRQVIGLISSSDATANHQRLIEDLVTKVVSFFKEQYNLGQEEAAGLWKKPGLELGLELGYYMPLTPLWSNAMQGTLSSFFRIKFLPQQVLFKLFRRPAWIYVGFGAGYSLGINTPGAEKFFYHLATLGLPLGLVATLGQGHQLGLEVMPTIDFGFMNLMARYTPGMWNSSLGYGVSLGLFYEFTINETWAVGLSNRFQVTFYTPLLVTYVPALTVRMKLLPHRKHLAPKVPKTVEPKAEAAPTAPAQPTTAAPRPEGPASAAAQSRPNQGGGR